MQKWTAENQIKFIDNESSFELHSGHVDTSIFVMSGRTPCVHLTPDGTVRLLKNIQKLTYAILILTAPIRQRQEATQIF